MTHPPTRVRTNNRHRRLTAEHRRGVVALALIAAFMVFVDGTIVNLTLAQLVTHLHASRSALQWALDAYTLSFAAVLLGAGAITDALGAKRAFVTGLLVFTVFSGVCAVSGSMLVLDLARLAQGAGAALLLPSALVLATASATDEQSRHRLVGWWAAAGGAGMAAGPLLGGALVALINWRAVFAVNVLVGVPAIAWSLRSMPPVASRARRLDLLGMGTATVLIGGVVFALIQGPVARLVEPGGPGGHRAGHRRDRRLHLRRAIREGAAAAARRLLRSDLRRHRHTRRYCSTSASTGCCLP